MMRCAIVLLVAACASAQVFPGSIASTSELWGGVNFAPTGFLPAGISPGAATINVTPLSVATFDADAPIVIGSEVIRCTGFTSNRFSGCSRGLDGTSAVSHVAGSPVVARLVAGHVTRLQDEVIAIEDAIGIDGANVNLAAVYIPQAPVSTTYNLASGATTVSLINETDAGRLVAFGCNLDIGSSNTGKSLQFNISIDGEAAESVAVYVSSGQQFFLSTSSPASDRVGPGDISDNKVSWHPWAVYNTSLSIGIQVQATGAGTVTCAAYRELLLD